MCVVGRLVERSQLLTIHRVPIFMINEMVLEMLKPHSRCLNHIGYFKFHLNHQMLEIFQVSEKELHTILGCRHQALAAIFLAHPEYNIG